MKRPDAAEVNRAADTLKRSGTVFQALWVLIADLQVRTGALEGRDRSARKRAEATGNDLLSDVEVAALLGCSPALLRRRRMQKRPPAFQKIGRMVRYSRQVIDEIIQGAAKL